MKRFLQTVVIVSALSITSCSSLSKLTDTFAKATTFKTTVETSDQILAKSQQLTRQSLLTFDAFVTLERHNEEMLKKVSPSIHVVANRVRKDGRNILRAMNRTSEAYRVNRTEGNAADMKTAYATLKQLYDEVKFANQQAINSTP
jgi:hypothetical protein